MTSGWVDSKLTAATGGRVPEVAGQGTVGTSPSPTLPSAQRTAPQCLGGLTSAKSVARHTALLATWPGTGKRTGN